MPKLPKGREKKVNRSFMIEDSVWQEFKAHAEDAGSNVSETARDLITGYNKRARAKAKDKPARDE